MMWPIFWPDDVQFTNPANTRHPSQDFDAEGQHIAEHIAAVVAPTEPRVTQRATGKPLPASSSPMSCPS